MNAAAPPPLVTRAFILLVVGHFLQGLGFASMLQLPLYLEHLGSTRQSIGTVMSVASIGGLALRPAVGWALDAFGRRLILYIGTLLVVMGMLLIGLVTQEGWLLYLDRILIGVGTGALFTAYFAFAADLIPESRRTEGIALFGISGLLPMAVNPLIGALDLPPSALRWVFPILGGIVALSLLVIMKLPEPPKAPRVGPPGLRPVLRALVRPPLWPVWLASAAFSGLVALFMTFATVAARQRGVSEPTVIWLTYTAGAISVRLVGARLPDRVGPANIVAPALGCYALACLLTAGSETSAGFALAGGLAGLGHGYCFPVLTSQVVTRSPAHLRGSALAGFTALWEMSTLILPPLFGRVADAFDDATMFALAAVYAAVGLALWAVLEHNTATSQTS